MPNSVSGFSGNEIVARVINFIGNSSSSFKSYVEDTLSLAQFRFCKMHDWGFLRKTDLALAVTSGISEYELSSATIGYYMAAEDVQSIYDETNGVYLQKVDLQDIRRYDSEDDDTNATGPTHWAPIGENRIKIYPPAVPNGTLRIDGTVTPEAFSNLATYPLIPFRYQESFIEYVTAMALDRENDDRAATKQATALGLIKEDIRADQSNRGGDINPRVRALTELQPNGKWNPLEDEY